MTYEIPAKRGSIYDRTGTVVLATSVQRDRLAANPKLLTPQRRAEVARELVTLLGLEGEAAANLTARMTSEREYVVLARGLESDGLRPDPGAACRQGREARGPHPGARAGAPLPAAGRRTGDDPRRAPPGLRQPRGHRPVRRRAVLRRRALGRPAAGRRPARRVGEPGARLLDGPPARVARAGRHRHHRRRPPGGGGAGAARRVDRRPGASASRRWSWTRTPARSTPRRPTPRTTPTTTSRSPRRSPRGSSTRSCPPSTSPARCSR